MKKSVVVWLTVFALAATVHAQSRELRRRAKAEGFTLAPVNAANAESAEGEGGEKGYSWPGIAIGIKGGTTGAGAELTLGINRWLNLRGGYNWLTFEPSLKVDEVKYKADLDLDTADLLLDIHPFGGVFRITGGAYCHIDGCASLSATPQKAWTKIGNHRYEPASIGTLKGRATVDDDVVPYVGLGWGNNVGEDTVLTFALDIGVMFQSYTVESLVATGSGASSSDSTFRDDLAKERRRIQKDLDDWSIYPVVTLSLAYHF